MRLLATVPLAAVVALGAAASAWQGSASDAATLIAALQIGPGSVVAEIGAGEGELSIAIASQVGAGGKVISSELGSRVQRLRQAVGKRADNVEVIEGHETRTNLPDGCCDAVFMRNVYHHFGDPPAMNASLLRALKPGGRIAVIDFPPRGRAATPPAGRRGEDGSHGASASTVATELETAGFRIVTTEERTRWFIVVGAKPPA